MRRRIAISILLALAVLAGAVFASSGRTAMAVQQAGDPQPGDFVTFLLPSAGNQPEPDAGPSTDKIIYTGGRITMVDGGSCATGTFPLQQAVLVDPGGLRSSRIVYVITVSQTDPVPPGTRLTNMVPETNCSVELPSGRTSMRRYHAMVE